MFILNRTNNITVCENVYPVLASKTMHSNFSCTCAVPDSNAIVHDIFSNNSCAVVMDQSVAEDDFNDMLKILMSALGERHMPLFIVISDKAASSEFPFVRYFSSVPDMEVFKVMLGLYRADFSDKITYNHENDFFFSDDNDLEREVTEIIRKIGIPANVKGYRYLKNAIMHATNDVTIMDSVTKLLYPAVAKDNHTTPTRVERAIRHAITSAWDRGDGDVDYIERRLHFKMNYRGQRPTNSELIALISDCLRINFCR